MQGLSGDRYMSELIAQSSVRRNFRMETKSTRAGDQVGEGRVKGLVIFRETREVEIVAVSGSSCVSQLLALVYELMYR